QNKKPFYITEHPLPDPDELNAVIPVAEWENGLDGKPSKPWKTTYVIYMVDLKTTGALYTYEHDTFGAYLCYTNLEEAIAVMRMLRGEHVYPIVHLEKRPWKSAKFGMQMRPHLQPTGDWRSPGRFQSMPPSPTPQISGPSTPTPTPTPTMPTPTSTPTTPATPATQDRQPHPRKEFLQGDPHQPQPLWRLERAERRPQTDIDREHAADPDDGPEYVQGEGGGGHEPLPIRAEDGLMAAYAGVWKRGRQVWWGPA